MARRKKSLLAQLFAALFKPRKAKKQSTAYEFQKRRR